MFFIPLGSASRATRNLPAQFQLFEANGTFTARLDGKYRVFVVGGGGSGGGQFGASGAGGSGYSNYGEVILSVGQQVPVTIGTGGPSGGNGDGYPGTASAFGIHLTAAGGGAGLNDGTGGDGGSGGGGSGHNFRGGADGSDGDGAMGGSGQGVGAISSYMDVFIAYRPYVGLGGIGSTFGGSGAGGGGGVAVGLSDEVGGVNSSQGTGGVGYGAGGGGSRMGGGSGGAGASGCVFIEGPI